MFFKVQQLKKSSHGVRSVQWVNNPLGRRDSNPWHHRTTRTGKNWDWTGDDDGTHDDDGDDDDDSYPAKNPPSIC